jgi:subtilisin family serine protease
LEILRKFTGLRNRRVLAYALAVSVVAVAPTAAQTTDEAIRQAIASGASARVIMQFSSTAARDAAFNRLLDRGAAVRAVDTEGGPALVVLGSATALSSEFESAAHVSSDAQVAVKSVTPARATRVRRSSGSVPVVSTVRTGATIAVIDSGIQPHADLPLSRIRYFKDFVSGSTTPIDKCGHGTHVAGIAAGTGFASFGEYAGIAPGTDIVALRVLGDDCSGNTSDVIDALEWIARNHLTYKIRVVNLSLGHPVFESILTDPMVQAVERLSRKGIVVVTAAGNMGVDPKKQKSGYGGVGVPCNAPSSICVGALDTQGTAAFDDDHVAAFSSRGPTRFDLLAKPDLVAPGVKITSLAAPGSQLFENYPQLLVFGGNEGPGKPAGYETLTGTSMSSPMVAGAAALVLAANRQLSANTVKLALQFTARSLPDVDALTQGAGVLNTGGAVRLAQLINPRTDYESFWLRQASMPVSNTDVSGQTITWSRKIIYGDRYIHPSGAQVHMRRWDDDIVWGYDTLDENIVWGSSTDDDNIVWGSGDDNIVWGHLNDDNIVWGSNIVWGHNIVSGYWAQHLVWGFWDEDIVWGNVTHTEMSDIVWGNGWEDIVWGSCSSAMDDGNIVWGSCDNNIVWGSDDNIVRGNEVLTGWGQ